MADEFRLHFPAWFENAQRIGTNADGEALAVGFYNGCSWLCRFSRFNDTWTTVRPANELEIAKYDEDFLATMRVTLDGDNWP